MIRDRIVFGINSSKIRQKPINMGKDLTLDKTIQIAQEYEYSQEQLKTMSSSEVNYVKHKHSHKYQVAVHHKARQVAVHQTTHQVAVHHPPAHQVAVHNKVIKTRLVHAATVEGSISLVPVQRKGKSATSA